MYSWKEIALMYKQEIEEFKDSLCNIKLTEKDYSIKRFIEDEIHKSDKNVSHIESFESSIKEKKKTKGSFIKKDYAISKEQIEIVEDLCLSINDAKKRIYSHVEKFCVIACMDWFVNNNYTIDINIELESSFFITKKNKRYSVKCLFSWMEFSGETRKYKSNQKFQQVSSQHSYNIDEDEDIKDIYIFCNFSNKDKKVTLYAWIKGEHIKELMVEPIIERFKGKNACVLQKGPYSNIAEKSDGVLSINSLL